MSRRRRLVGALVASLLGAVSLLFVAAAPAHAIAGGEPVPEGRYRFAVKLTFTDIPRPDGSHYNSACSASLISAQWIITAGHCFHDVNRNPVSGPVPYQAVATIGRVDDADTNGFVVALVEDYQSPTNDIAVAKLATPVYGIAPLRLSTHAPTAGEILRITGWGSLDDVTVTPATHLQTGQVTVDDVQDTTVGVVGYRPLPTTSACVYDSGAPYFFEPRHGAPLLVSVESEGPDCPHDQVETTSRVDAVVPWIRATLHQHR